MFNSIAKFSVKFRWPIIILWIAAVPILTSSLPKLADVSKNDNSQFLPKNSQTQKASDLEANFQSKDTVSQEVLIASRENGPLTKADNQAIDQAVARIKSTEGVSQVQAIGTSKDGKAREVLVGIGNAGFGPFNFFAAFTRSSLSAETQRAYTAYELEHGPQHKRVQGLRDMPAMNPGVPQPNAILPLAGTRQTEGR